MRRLRARSPPRTTSTRPATLADEYIRNFMQQEPIPGIAYEYGAATSASCPRSRWPRSTRWPRSGCRIATASSWSARRRRPGVPMPDEAKLARSSTAAAAAALTAYVDTVSDAAAARASADAGRDRQDRAARAARHHRVGAVERRARRAQADDVQGGRDPVPRLQPGRHVARERRRLHRRRHRRSGRSPQAASGSWTRIDLEQEAGRQDRVGPADIDEMEEGLRGGASRTISRRCSS